MYRIKNKEFINAYDAICMRHDRLNVFSDFVKICSISIYNAFAQNQEMEKEYLRTINSYNKEEQSLFIKMFSELIMIFEESKEVVDLLGPIYMDTKSKDSKLGQVFTPEHVAELLARIAIGDEKSFKNQIEKNGFVTVLDPACGSGRISFILC